MRKFFILTLTLILCSTLIFNGACDGIKNVLGIGCEHSFEEVEKVLPTCTADGEISYVCAKCGQTKTEGITKAGHDYSAGHVVDEFYHWYNCKVCSENSQKKAHEYVDGVCECGKLEQKAYVREGNTVYFGEYPQTEITDFARTSVLMKEAGDFPTSNNPGNWTVYEYSIEGETRNYMWYIDLELNGAKYRGVYYANYRPYLSSYHSSAENSYQDDYKYYSHIVYWFKYEPIKWTIIQEKNATAILLCDSIIDAQDFYSRYNFTRTISGKKVYPNNYEHSSIREWLNRNFFETAFSSSEKYIIYTSVVDNSINSTLNTENKYLCNNTRDKVYFLSHADIYSGEYALTPEMKQKKVTEYAMSQGCWVSTAEETSGKGYWWLRTPDGKNNFFAGRIDANGVAGSYDYVDASRCGVAPVLKIQL